MDEDVMQIRQLRAPFKHIVNLKVIHQVERDQDAQQEISTGSANDGSENALCTDYTAERSSSRGGGWCVCSAVANGGGWRKGSNSKANGRRVPVLRRSSFKT